MAAWYDVTNYKRSAACILTIFTEVTDVLRCRYDILNKNNKIIKDK